jgi:transposase
MSRYDLTDFDWRVIKPLLPNKPRGVTRLLSAIPRTAGQAHDGQVADTLLDRLGPHPIVLVDKAYDADPIRELIQQQGATPNIPPRSNRRWTPCFSK